MKRNTILVCSLAFFALVDGFLLSAISLVGRTGINLFYTEYKFLKTWWKAGLLVYIVWILLFIIQLTVNKKAARKTAKSTHIILMIVAIAGLYISYSDFRDSISHRWLGERFHLGVYLFWLGWIAISVFFLTGRRVTEMEVPETPVV